MYTIATLTIIAVTLANAQLPTLPTCATACFNTALANDGCSGLTDFACHCSKPSLVSQIQPCVAAACSSSDQSSVNSAVSTICKSAGVSIDLSGASSASPSSTSAPQSSAVTSSAAAAGTSPSSVATSTAEATTTAETSSTLASNVAGTTAVGYASPTAATAGNTTTGLEPFTGGAGSSLFGGRVVTGLAILIAVVCCLEMV